MVWTSNARMMESTGLSSYESSPNLTFWPPAVCCVAPAHLGGGTRIILTLRLWQLNLAMNDWMGWHLISSKLQLYWITKMLSEWHYSACLRDSDLVIQWLCHGKKCIHWIWSSMHGCHASDSYESKTSNLYWMYWSESDCLPDSRQTAAA